LLKGVRLAEARALDQRRDIALREPDAHKLYTRSVARERRTERQRFAAILVALALVAAVALVFFIQRQGAIDAKERAVSAQQAAVSAQQDEAKQRQLAEAAENLAEVQRRAALARQLAAQSLNVSDTQYDLGLLLGAEATGGTDLAEVKGALHDALEHNP